ncbi:MAG: 5-formyltetrahydrofolate cyclo-ligase [Firmicutes bacterium]|nr:5-formyltetrahydrofolate cyclo-ligase [Bacillota bacterium]
MDNKKHQLREEIKRLRRELEPEKREEWSRKIRRRLLVLPEVQAAKTLMGYLALPGEVIVDPLLIRLQQAGTRVGVPVLLNGEIVPYELTAPERLTTGSFGLREPDPRASHRIPPAQIDLIIMPGLAFDEAGHRLGFGKGYYDRFLARFGAKAKRPKLLAVAFDFQVYPEIPSEEHDIPVDAVLTPTRLIRV